MWLRLCLWLCVVCRFVFVVVAEIVCAVVCVRGYMFFFVFVNVLEIAVVCLRV